MIGSDLRFDAGSGECGKEGQRARAAVGQPTLLVDGCRWCRMGAESRASWMDAVLAAARDAGCPAAEIFVKEGRARQITIEPSSGRRRASGLAHAGGRRGPPGPDPARRPGFAWVNLAIRSIRRPARAALQSAGLGPAPGHAWTATPAATVGASLDLVDPACCRWATRR